MNSISKQFGINFRKLNLAKINSSKFISSTAYLNNINETPKDTKSDSGSTLHEIILSESRKLTVRNWRGSSRVDIREYLVDDKTNNVYPTKKGISLTVDQWKMIVENIEKIESVLEEAESNKAQE